MNSRAEINIARAGEFFVYCLWLQGQMTDLIILGRHPKLIPPFSADPSIIPHEMVGHRATYWKKSFEEIRAEFERQFGEQIGDTHRRDLQVVHYLRNAIAHSHVSIAREYFLYRPGRGEKQESQMIEALGVEPSDDQASPRMFALRFYDDEEYVEEFNRIKRLDEECFSSIASSLGVRHGRIR